MVTKTYNLNTASNYNYDDTKIGIANGEANLVLQPNPGVLYQEDFANDTDFTYNSSLAEFVGGRVEQKDQTPSDSVLGSSFLTSDFVANWNKDYSTSAVINGTPVYNNGVVECFGANGLYYEIDSTVEGAIKVKYTPNYDTTPSSNVDIFSLFTGGSGADRIILSHSPSSSTLRLTIRDSLNANVFFTSAIGGSWNPNSGQSYEIELNYSATTGDVRVFIDGNLHGTLSASSWSRGTGKTRIYIGASPAIYNMSDASFDDLIVFSTVQHTASYTAGYSVAEKIYLSTSIRTPDFDYNGTGNVLSVDDAFFDESSDTRWTLNGFWWDGAQWAPSNGTYDQANTSSTLVANFPNLNVTGVTTFFGDIYFPNSNTQNFVSEFDVEVTGQIYPTDTPRLQPINNERIFALSIASFNANFTASGSDTIKFLLVVNGTKTYWNGSSWVASNGLYAQTNDLATIQANIGTLLSDRSQVGVEAFLYSDDGSTTPVLQDISFTYDAALPDPTLTRTIDINGFVYDSLEPISGLTIETRPYQKGFNNPNTNVGGGVFHAYQYRDLATTTSDGFFSGSILKQPTDEFWEFKIGKQRYYAQLPDKDIVDINELTLTLSED